MTCFPIFTAAVFLIGSVASQARPPATSPEAFPPGTAIPIRFTRTVDANKIKPGDRVYAKTTQVVSLGDGAILPQGSEIIAHVVQADPFTFDKAPYANQKSSTLSIRFESISDRGHLIPISVYVRALADPFATWDSQEPPPSDEDPLGTTTQVGGDQVTRSQKEVRSMNNDVVGFNRRNGVYAHLLPATGNSPEGCDATHTEQAVGIFSASACGLYGFSGMTLQHTGRTPDLSLLVLTSSRHAAQIHANSSALLEVNQRSTGSRLR